MPGGAADNFTWPPSPPAGAAHSPATPLDRDARIVKPTITLDDLLVRRRPGRVRNTLHEIERVWLGFGSRGVGDRLIESRWTPPPACWRCGGLVGAHEVDGEGCATCRAIRVPWSRFVRLGVYDGVLREAVLELKQTSWRRVGTELGAMLGKRLAIELERCAVERDRVVLAPIPTTHRRRLSRGVDHTLVLARAAAAKAGVRLARPLTRAHRPRQTTLPATDRARNVRNTFGLSGDLRLGSQVVVVLDDVRTTGATLRAACRALEKGDAVPPGGVWACVVAVADDRRAPASSGVKIQDIDARLPACPD